MAYKAIGDSASAAFYRNQAYWFLLYLTNNASV
jgi:hypothetical protein